MESPSKVRWTTFNSLDCFLDAEMNIRIIRTCSGTPERDAQCSEYRSCDIIFVLELCGISVILKLYRCATIYELKIVERCGLQCSCNTVISLQTPFQFILVYFSTFASAKWIMTVCPIKVRLSKSQCKDEPHTSITFRWVETLRVIARAKLLGPLGKKIKRRKHFQLNLI